MLNLLLLTAGIWTAISLLFVSLLRTARPNTRDLLRRACLYCMAAAGFGIRQWPSPYGGTITDRT